MSCRSLLFAFGVAVAFPTSVLVQCLFEGKAYTGGATLQMVNGLHVCVLMTGTAILVGPLCPQRSP
jgi:hypothetical protein